MSDTESDIDFESADEGEDQNNSENTSVNQSTWGNRKKIRSESELMKHEENENFKSSDKITDSADASFELEKTREPECNTLVKDEMQTNHLSTPCKEGITDNKNNDIDKESSICKQVIQKAKDEFSDKSASFPKEIEPKRVTLRLEKKLQQKNHETSSHDLQEESEICEKPQEEIKRVTLRLEKKLQQKNQKTIHHLQEESEICEKLQEVKVSESKPSLWGWGSWGTTLLSSAASSVSTFTTHVSEGIGTVLETVETTLGAPPPEELAAALKENSDCLNVGAAKSEEYIGDEAEEHEDEGNLGSSLLGGVTSWSKAFENTGAKVLMGGLDTLELIGKKTIDILTEGDPGLRKKRSVFSQGTTLSQVLREAKEKAEELNAAETDSEQDETVHYSKLFDEFQGLIHLEALEMLSGQSQTKVHGLLMLTTDSVEKNHLNEIKLICENLPSPDDTPDDEADQDFSNLVAEHVQKLQLSINTEKIKFVQMAAHDWIANCKKDQDSREIIDPKVIYHRGISCLAEFTSKSVEQFHRVAELILVKANAEDDPIHSATHLTGLTSVLCIEIGIIASKFCQCLSTAADDSENPDLITPLITSVYLEASNSTTYIQDAFQLLVPVLQLLLLQREIIATKYLL